MQTFIPTAKSFAACARRLDDKRLPNQANEALTIYRTLTGYYPSRKNGMPGGWPNHPAVLMWRGYEAALLHYRHACIIECARRGIVRNFAVVPLPGAYTLPPWWGRADIHASHRAMLCRKDARQYAQWRQDAGRYGDYVWGTPAPEPAVQRALFEEL